MNYRDKRSKEQNISHLLGSLYLQTHKENNVDGAGCGGPFSSMINQKHVAAQVCNNFAKSVTADLYKEQT